MSGRLRAFAAPAMVVAGLMASATVAHASGHGPVFGGATPTLGKGGWQFDQSWMVRNTDDTSEHTLRSMLSFGITERVQISVSAPIPLTTGSQSPAGRMTTSMPDTPNLEGTLSWRFHSRPVGLGARVESTVFAAAAIPTVGSRGGVRASPSATAGIASGYASRIHYFWAAAGYEKRFARQGDRWSDVGFYSIVYGYRPPALRLDYPKPDLRFFVEIQGEHNSRARVNGVAQAGSGGRVLLAGPTTLLLYKQYGLEAGVLFPVSQRVNGVQPRERYRAVINATYFFWIH